MKRLILILLLVATPIAVLSCANKQAPLVAAQTSHDTLAIAQDLEAQLCFGVADALHSPTDPVAAQHCTTPTAQTIHLTDALHKQINSKLRAAFDLHRALTAGAESGSAVDWSNYNAALTEIVTLIQQLQQTPEVQQLLASVKGATK